jgi:phage I-like protein
MATVSSQLLALHAAPPKGLVALKAISNAALAEQQLPGRLKLLNWGTNDTIKGPVTVGDATLRHLAANQARAGYEHVALDYNHNSLPGHPNYQPDPREVAAYGAVEVVANDGLYLAGIDYTPSGLAKALNYRDLSPTPLLDQNGEVIFLHSVALCPQGAVRDLSFYSAGDAGLAALSAAGEDSAAGQDDPPPVTAVTMDYRRLLCAMLDLDPDQASDDDIAAAAHQAAADKRTAAEVAAQPAPEPMSVRVDRIEREFVIGNGLLEGKIIPLSVRALPLTQLRQIVAELPGGQVPTKRQTPGVLALAVTAPPNAADEEVRRRLGIPPETWSKHNA